MSSQLRAQIVKELLSTLRDPRSRFILIGPPMLQLFVFSYAATLDVRNVDIAVLDLDRGAAALELVQQVENADFVDRLERVSSLAQLGDRIDRQQALVGLHIASGFSRDAVAGRPAKVQMLLDGRRANTAQIAASYLAGIARQLSVEIMDDGAPQTVMPQTVMPQTVVRHWFNPNLTYSWFIVPSLSGILAMFISLLVTALSIARERELGTFDQLLVSPATSFEIIVAKTVPALMVGSLLALLMVAAGVFVFGIPFTGSLGLLVASLLLFILSIVGLGLMLSAVCQTQQQAILGTFSIGIPLILISGFATPVENMPSVLQALAELSPLKHYLVIVQGSFLKALPPSEVFANAWPMAVIAAVTLSMAVIFVQRRLQ